VHPADRYRRAGCYRRCNSDPERRLKSDAAQRWPSRDCETGPSPAVSCGIEYFTRSVLPGASTAPRFFTDDFARLPPYGVLGPAPREGTISILRPLTGPFTQKLQSALKILSYEARNFIESSKSGRAGVE
jgi:hypothetical protein